MLIDKRQDAQKISSLMLRVRRLQKMIGTYYDRMESRIYPDGCVRLFFHHCGTFTGRLTSDFHQVPRSDKGNVKRMFVTRYRS